jgi:hypothetical protein
MTRAATLAALVTLAAACGGNTEAAPTRKRMPVAALRPVTELCVTRGTAKLGEQVTEPTMRAVAPGTSGDAAALQFVFRGDSADTRELASGQARRQLGLKLRAADGCNLVYVMWRLDPRPALEVSVKRNPGKHDHAACGADGYTKVKPTKSWRVPALAVGDAHTLRATIAGDDLTVWIDDDVAWRGSLPRSTRTLHGPAGMRSDNVAFELIALSAPPAPDGSERACTAEHAD